VVIVFASQTKYFYALLCVLSGSFFVVFVNPLIYFALWLFNDLPFPLNQALNSINYKNKLIHHYEN